MHLVVILLTLGCPRDLSFILDLKEKRTQIHVYIFKIQTDNYAIRYNIWEYICGYVCDFPIHVI